MAACGLLALGAVLWRAAQDAWTLGVLLALGIPVTLVIGHVAVKVIRAARDSSPAAPPRPAATDDEDSGTERSTAWLSAVSLLAPRPSEDRFMRLARSRKLLNRQQIAQCLQLKAERGEQGEILPVWECVVAQGLLDQEAVDDLRRDAGDMDADGLGDFTVIRKLGEGGMGHVWLAMGPDDQLVAVKVLSREYSRQRSYLTRFLREGKAAIKLQHDNIVRGIAVGEEAGDYYFAMEFVAGKNCTEMIEGAGRISPRDATLIIGQIASGLAYAHERGIIHRDIKPSNILITRWGIAKLADLGLARQTGTEMTVLTRTGATMGTPHYMAPEQITDAKRADQRSDLYSLGATWYHMVAGQQPFMGSSPLEVCQKHLDELAVPPKDVCSDVPDAVSDLIVRMLAKDPDQRPQTAREVCEAIENECLPPLTPGGGGGGSDDGMDTTLWEMELSSDHGVRRQSLFLAEVRDRIKKGEVSADTLVRPVGAETEFRPAASVPVLKREFADEEPSEP